MYAFILILCSTSFVAKCEYEYRDRFIWLFTHENKKKWITLLSINIFNNIIILFVFMLFMWIYVYVRLYKYTESINFPLLLFAFYKKQHCIHLLRMVINTKLKHFLQHNQFVFQLNYIESMLTIISSKISELIISVGLENAVKGLCTRHLCPSAEVYWDNYD